MCIYQIYFPKLLTKDICINTIKKYVKRFVRFVHQIIKYIHIYFSMQYLKQKKKKT